MLSRRLCHRFFTQNYLQSSAKRTLATKLVQDKIQIGQIDADGVHTWKQIRLGILGAPFHMGQPHDGVEKSPALIRHETGFVERLKELGHDVKDYGDLDHFKVNEDCSSLPKHLDNPLNNISYAKRLSDEVERITSDNRMLLTIGGDHSISMATVHGHLKVHPDACVIWVDAHADINTPLTSDTGHMHGMPISFQLRDMADLQPDMPNFEWFKPLLETNRLAYIGLREVDPLERTILNRLSIPSYSMREVDELGVRECLKRALDDIDPKRNRPLHVSFDIDALDPLEAPCTGTPVRGGLTLREGMTILEDCFATGNLCALDLVEVNFHLSHYEDGTKTLQAAKNLILAAMGYYRGGRPPLPQYLEKLQGKIIPERNLK